MVTNKSEIRGVFVHSGSFGNADWGLIAQTLADYNVGMIAAPFIGNPTSTYYPSNYATNVFVGRDLLSEALIASHAEGIALYVVMDVLAEGNFEEQYQAWDFEGNLAPNNCPIRVRNQIKNVVEELVVKYPNIDGFMFDYIRYLVQDMCYCNDCKARFEEWLGEGTITDWTPFADGGSRWLEYAEWRSIPVTELVKDMRNWMLAIKPDLGFSAAIFTGFDDCPTYWRKYIGQDTGLWVKEGYLDSFAPMMYTKEIGRLANYIDTELKYFGGVEGSIPLVAFLRTEYDDVDLTPAEFEAQINLVRSKGLDGWVVWRYGGPGVTYPANYDIRNYLSIIDMPEVFSLTNISSVRSGGGTNVFWNTDLPTTSKVEYSTSQLFTAVWSVWGDFNYWHINHNMGNFIEDNTLKTSHAIMIPTDEAVYFRVQSQTSEGIATSPVHYTGEAPPPPMTTPFSSELEEGVYTISVPTSVKIGSDTYLFKQWSDGDINPVKTVQLTADTELTAEYSTLIQAGFPIWILILAAGGTAYLFIKSLLGKKGK